jgi:hypothetical protein
MNNGVIPSHCFCGVGPYTRSANPVWSFVDLTGNQFDDTFYMWVLSNQIPYVPAAVYQTPTGTPWTDPIRFLANGTLPNNIYWDPNVIYRLEFRHNLGLLPPSQNDPLIYLVENYAPNGNNAELENISNLTTSNQVSNSQFVEVNFQSPFTLTNVTNPPPIEIAPDWFLTLTGTGNVTINQIPLYDAPGLTNPTNAPYALEINLTGGWTGNPILSQTLPVNGMLWANKYVSLSFTGLIQTAPAPVTARLIASNGQPIAVFNNNILSNTFTEYTSVALLPGTMNANIPPNANIQFQMLLPANGDIYLTSFQLVASTVDTPYEYQQETVSRQKDQLFHYYNPKLQFKQTPSYLVGWDFPLNPAQFNGSAVAAQAVGANASYYAWDQTILFQSANSGLTVSRGAQGGLTVTAAQVGQFAVIQYLGQIEARKILQDAMSVNLAALGNVAAGNVIGSISLWYTKDANLPNVATGTNQTFIATLDPVTGRPATFTGGTNWIEITRDIRQNATFNIASGTLEDFGFNGWAIDNGVAADANLATFFAIVIGFAPLAVNDAIEINSVSLVAGDIPSKPAPQTVDEVLRTCEHYYEKSYASGTVPATVTNVNSICKAQGAWLQGGVAYRMVAGSFSVDYKTVKRTSNATINLYNPATGTINQVLGTVFGSGSAAQGTGNISTAIWTPTLGSKSTYFTLTTYNQAVTEGSFAGGNWASGAIQLHYVVDARLGIVN